MWHLLKSCGSQQFHWRKTFTLLFPVYWGLQFLVSVLFVLSFTAWWNLHVVDKVTRTRGTSHLPADVCWHLDFWMAITILRHTSNQTGKLFVLQTQIFFHVRHNFTRKNSREFLKNVFEPMSCANPILSYFAILPHLVLRLLYKPELTSSFGLDDH